MPLVEKQQVGGVDASKEMNYEDNRHLSSSGSQKASRMGKRTWGGRGEKVFQDRRRGHVVVWFCFAYNFIDFLIFYFL